MEIPTIKNNAIENVLVVASTGYNLRCLFICLSNNLPLLAEKAFFLHFLILFKLEHKVKSSDYNIPVCCKAGLGPVTGLCRIRDGFLRRVTIVSYLLMY